MADAPAQVIAETSDLVPAAATEIPFELPYDAAAISETGIYAVRARVNAADDSLLYVSDTFIPVITGEAPTEGVSVALVEAAAAAEASAMPSGPAAPEASPAS
jgi:uncharacterized lipoprotein YbaY